MQFRTVLLLGLLSITSIPAVAQTPAPKADEKPEIKLPSLTVGSKAPALSIEKWIKGAPVASFEKGKVYMVEFWATWCGPCIASMPHLTELQKKHGAAGLTIVSIGSTDKRGNSLEKSEKMVADKGDVIGYTVAWGKERETWKAYMEAAQQGGIPCSFLVDQNGDIAYIGHPVKIDDTLAAVMAKKHDIKALAASYQKSKENDAKVDALGAQFGKLSKAEDWAGAVKVLDQILALDPKEYAGVAINKFMIQTKQLKEYDQAAKDATAYFFDGAGKDNAQAMNALAWGIVDPEGEIEHKDLDLAMKLAVKANELTKNEEPAIMDTLARVHFSKGELEKAVEVQTKAVTIDAGKNKDLQKSLDEYKDAVAKKGKG